MKIEGLIMFETARVPINSTAKRVTSEGYKYTPDKKITTLHSPFPFETIAPSRALKNNPSFIDLTGTKFGQFTVIGLFKESTRKWVVKCSCGNYEVRLAKSVKNQENFGDRCAVCRHTSYLIRHDEFRAKGFNNKDSRNY